MSAVLTTSEEAYVERGRSSLRDAGLVVTSELVLRARSGGHSWTRARVEFARADGSGRPGLASLRPGGGDGGSPGDPGGVAVPARPGGSSRTTDPGDLGRLALTVTDSGDDPEEYVTNEEYETLVAAVSRLGSADRLAVADLDGRTALGRALRDAVEYREVGFEGLASAVRTLASLAEGVPLEWLLRHHRDGVPT